jgi:hypothetical protein
MNIILYTRIIICWMILIGILTTIINVNDKTTTYIRFGPQEDLFIVGIQINTYNLYFCVVLYCVFNTILRTINTGLISPYITNYIQDTFRSENIEEIKMYGYEIVVVNILFIWFDWVASLIIIFTQFDFMLYQLICEIIISLITTHYYINNKNNSVIDDTVYNRVIS